MTRSLLILALAIGCSSASTPDETPSAPAGTCADAGDAAISSRAILHLWGRRATSSLEVKALADRMSTEGRATVLAAMMEEPEFVERWLPFVLDMLYVNRTGERANIPCSGEPAVRGPGAAAAGPELAAHVRDTAPADAGFAGAWNLYDLASSALRLDDLSPLYRVQLFAQAGSRLFDAENPMHELAWRRTYSQIFERNYLNRRMECLGCHNSKTSVTSDPDPDLNRTWQPPGLIERAIYGADDGMTADKLDAFFRLVGVFAMDFVPEGLPDMPDRFWDRGFGVQPWGMIHECGEFVAQSKITPDELLGGGHLVDDFGKTASLWDLERLLADGFSAIRGAGPQIADDGTLDGRQALAWQVALTTADRVWEELTGYRLTTPHGFPRNRAQRDLLVALANAFVNDGFSLKAMLHVAFAAPAFNVGGPDACTETPYPVEAVLNPWVREEPEPEARLNGAGDAITRVPARLLLQSARFALDWAPLDDEPEDRPMDDEQPMDEDSLLLIDIGAFALDGETGFRGSSMREALAWEAATGSCEDPHVVEGRQDWVARLAVAAADSTLRDALVTLKDRLLAHPHMDVDEESLLEALLETPLSSKPTEALLRRACGVFLSSPRFVLDGVPWPLEPAAPPLEVL